jgi:hypothetical protein
MAFLFFAEKRFHQADPMEFGIEAFITLQTPSG